MKKITAFILLLITSVPVSALAVSAFTDTQALINSFGGLIKSLILVVAGIALLVFFWGLVKFILKAGDEKSIADGRRLMVWGVIALFVMISVWGLVRFLQGELLPRGDFSAPPGLGGGLTP